MNVVVTAVGATCVTSAVFTEIPKLGIDDQILFMISLPKSMSVDNNWSTDPIDSIEVFKAKYVAPFNGSCPKCGRTPPPKRNILT
jgi:hypothetical protein